MVSAQTKWDLPAAYAASNFHTENLVQFAADVDKATAGKLKITVHANASLFKAPEIKRAVQQGQVPIGEVLIEGARRHIGVRGYLLDCGARPNAPQELNGGVEDVRSGAGERSVLPPLPRGLLPRGLGSRSRCCHGFQCTRRGGLSIDTSRINE